jgi:N-acetylmuramoyl-L-alanine amidase
VLLLLPAAASLAGPTVALDIGHSSASPGATSARGRGEFYFNRDLAVQMARVLEGRHFEVRTINLDGAESSLEARSAQARGADVLLSVHHDSVQPHYLESWTVRDERQLHSERFAGFSLFVSRRNPDPAASLGCAVAIGSALRSSGFTPSLHHAEPIAGEYRALADAANGVYYFDDLVILRTATQPAVLLEAGIIVNRDEEALLVRSDVQLSISRAVASGLGECLRTKNALQHEYDQGETGAWPSRD